MTQSSESLVLRSRDARGVVTLTLNPGGGQATFQSKLPLTLDTHGRSMLVTPACQAGAEMK